ncbi:hypothetical protein ACFLTD_03005 [Elusimicrobiota bacterium]
MKILGIDTAGHVTAVALFDSAIEGHVIFNETKRHDVRKVWAELPFVLPGYHSSALRDLMETVEAEYRDFLNEADICAVSAYSGIRSCIKIGLDHYDKEIRKKWPNMKLTYVDHQVGHLFSSFIGRSSNLSFPSLFFTSSACHMAMVYIETKNKYSVIIDDTPKIKLRGTDVFCGLGQIYNMSMEKILHLNDNNACGNDYAVFEALVSAGSPAYVEEILSKCKIALSTFDFYGLFKIVCSIMAVKEKKINAEDMARSFNECFGRLFVERVQKLLAEYPCREFHLCGGLSDNKFIVEELKKMADIAVVIPLKEFRFDNAAMIANAVFVSHVLDIDIELEHNVFESGRIKYLIRRMRKKAKSILIKIQKRILVRIMRRFVKKTASAVRDSRYNFFRRK